MNHLATLFSAIALPIMTAYGQTDTPDDMLPQAIPPTSHSQLFQAQIDHPVCEYNGLPEITIPLYEIKTKGFTIPIMLSYRASGVKYNHLNSYVADGTQPELSYHDGELGAGWTLSIGGYRMMRTINGKADEMRPKASPEFYKSIILDAEASDKYLSRILYDRGHNTPFDMDISKVGYLDGEYDFFSYNLPTTNGQFILDENYTPQHIGTSLDLINMNVTQANKNSFEGSIKNITLKDTKGNTFYLGHLPDSEISYTEKVAVTIGATEPAFDVGWPLMRILTPYGETLNFSYSNHKAYTRPLPRTVIANSGTVYTPPHNTQTIPADYGNIRTQVTFPTINYGELLLDKVETENVIIEIFRKDSPSNVIQRIQISDKTGKAIRNIEFSYHTTNKSRWHNLLAKISVYRSISEGEEYNFEYYAPAGKEFQLNIADQWGYYKSRLSAWPLFTPFIHQEFTEEKIVTRGSDNRMGPIIGTMEKTSYFRNFESYLADRSGDNLYPSSFSLKKIIYPTKGSAEFIYEPNEYWSSTLARKVKAGGQRIRKIILRESENSPELISEYKYGEGESGLGKANLDISPAFFLINSSSTNTYFITTTSYGHITTFSKTFSQDPLLPEASQFQVQYGMVTKYRYGATDNYSQNGKIVSQYLIPEQYRAVYAFEPSNIISPLFGMVMHSRWASLTINGYWPGLSPVLTERTYYDAQLKPVQKSQYDYKTVCNHIFEGIKTSQIANFPTMYLRKKQPDHDLYSAYYDFNRVVGSCYATIHMDAQLLSSQQDISYFGADSIIVSKTFEYDPQHRLVRETQSDSNNSVIAKEYTYPDATLANGLVLSNMLQHRIRIRSTKDSTETSRLHYNYSGNAIWPTSVSQSVGNGPQRTLFTLDRYDSRGNLLQSSDPNGIPTTYLWGYQSTCLVAEIKNATYQQVAAVLGQAQITAISDRMMLSESDIAILNGLRSNPALSGAQVVSYTHHPVFGITRHTDSRGVSTSYLYDEMGRLKEITDDAGNPVEAYDYKYKK